MPEDEDDDCGGRCKENAGVLVTDEVCHTLSEKSDIDCKKLVQDVLDKKITPREYVDTIIEVAEEIGNHNDAEILREIKRLMYEPGE